MIDRNFIDNYDADVLIFHGDYPFSTDVDKIRKSTKRSIDFLNVDNIINRMPVLKGFDPYIVDPTWRKRGKWSYHGMIRFWFSDIFSLPIMDNVEYFLRLDDDSVFQGPVINVFQIIKNKSG